MEYSYLNDKLNSSDPLRNIHNVNGPFYAQSNCISCGAPGSVAPNNIKFTYDVGIKTNDRDSGCIVVRQPSNIDELKLLIKAMDSSCIECIRYCGSDAIALDLISKAGYVHLID